MKIAIIYDSITGNTKKIAEEIKKEIDESNLVYFGEPEKEIEADLYIVGSWTDKGMCSKKITEFLKKKKNKKIAYFGTAGFGGSIDTISGATVSSSAVITGIEEATAHYEDNFK